MLDYRHQTVPHGDIMIKNYSGIIYLPAMKGNCASTERGFNGVNTQSLRYKRAGQIFTTV